MECEPNSECAPGPDRIRAMVDQILAPSAKLLTRKPALSALAGSALGVLVWKFSSSAVQDVLIFAAFGWALLHRERGRTAWRSPAGIAFAALLVHMLVMIPFSLEPRLSFRDFTRMIEVAAAAYAIPILFNTWRRLEAAMLYTAVGIALTLGFDLIRLWVRLGPRILADAHTYEPFIMNHSNVASMMAGAAAFIFAYFCLANRSRPMATIAALAGVVLCVVYKVVVASRGPQIAFAVALGLAGFLTPGRCTKAAWAVTVLAAAACLVWGIKYINPRFLEKTTLGNFSERTTVWAHTWQLAQEHPVLGHGYGKRLFVKTYYASNPPRASFKFPHAHEFWLKLLFEYGWTGLALHAAAWLVLMGSLLRHTLRLPMFQQRLLPGVLLVMLVFIHVYGLADFPDNIVEVLLYWLAAAALAVMALPPNTAKVSTPQ